MTAVSVTRDLPASCDEAWALVADVTRMGEWSPEATGATWLGGATGPAVGAKFTGTNASGGKEWSTVCTITACEPGRSFAFAVKGGPFKVSTWTYAFEPTDAGCRVTETWTDQRGWLVTTLGKRMTGVDDRAAHNRANMEATLAALAAAVG